MATDSAPSARACAIGTLVDELLGQPVVEAYPLPAGEDAAAWAAASRQALADLLARGLLDARDGFGGTLADALERLAKGPLPQPLETSPGRVRLLGELVRNLAHPGRINQGLKGTCAVTCIEVHAAEAHPAEYARLVAGLCGPTGAIGLRNGEALLRDERTLIWSQTEARRSPISRLFQVAAMELAYPDLDYRNLADGHYRLTGEGPVESRGTGMDLGEFDRLLEGITGTSWSVLTDMNDDFAALLGWDPATVLSLERDGLGIIERSLADGAAAFVTLASPEAADQPQTARHPLVALPHKVKVLAIDHEAGRAYYEDPLDPEDPWIPDVPTRVEDDTGRCSMALADFQALVVELSYMPRYAPEQTRR